MTHQNKKILSYVLAACVAIVALIWVGGKFLHLGNVEYTDNAQVRRQVVPVISRVQGYIKEIRFSEFEPVKKGDTLVIIDDSDMRLNVARAAADYSNALSGSDAATGAVTSASANVAVSEASIAEAKVIMDLAAKELERFGTLLADDAVTLQQYDAVKTDYEAKKARYEMLVRQRSATTTVVDVNRSRAAQSQAGIDMAKAVLETAQLNLSYTVITAPCDGYTSRKDICIGQLVQPGQTLLDVVADSDLRVIANFKETQLEHIHHGSEVEIKVDAVPGVKYRGVVTTISMATGASLSLMPQDNSAGNFVKVRQRVPVRIEFTSDNSAENLALLRNGMNVECNVKY